MKRPGTTAVVGQGGERIDRIDLAGIAAECRLHAPNRGQHFALNTICALDGIEEFAVLGKLPFGRTGQPLGFLGIEFIEIGLRPACGLEGLGLLAVEVDDAVGVAGIGQRVAAFLADTCRTRLRIESRP